MTCVSVLSSVVEAAITWSARAIKSTREAPEFHATAASRRVAGSRITAKAAPLAKAAQVLQQTSLIFLIYSDH